MHTLSIKFFVNLGSLLLIYYISIFPFLIVRNDKLWCRHSKYIYIFNIGQLLWLGAFMWIFPYLAIDILTDNENLNPCWKFQESKRRSLCISQWFKIKMNKIDNRWLSFWHFWYKFTSIRDMAMRACSDFAWFIQILPTSYRFRMTQTDFA